MAPLRSAEQPKIALVHDFLLDVRGAERVFLAIADLWPEADIFTAVYDEDGTEGRFADRVVHTSFLQRLHPTARTFRALLPFYPAAIESFDLSAYDLVLSSSSAWAHGVICGEDTVHVCYCHNPFRYAWNDREPTLANRDPVTRVALRTVLSRWRQWDWLAAQRVDRYVSNSHPTKRRIAAYWGRESTVVYPPVETSRFEPGRVGDYYLVLSELVAHKRIDVVIAAFNRLGLPLVVVGDGPDTRRLRRLAHPNVHFTGRVGDREVERLLQGCRALVSAAVEEFGIAAVEAQAAGRPVIALDAGGVQETVQDGVTGCLWKGGPAELADVVAGFHDADVDPQACVANAERFALESFRRELPRHVDRALAEAERGLQRAPRDHARRWHQLAPRPPRTRDAD